MCFLVTFCTTQKVTIRTPLRREFRGFANLESAHQNSKFVQTKLNPFAASPLFPTFCKVQKVGQKTLKLSFRKVLPLSGQHALRALRRPRRHFPMLLPQQIFALRAVFGGKPPKMLSVCTEAQCVRMTFPIFLLAYSTLCACSGCSNGNVA